MVNGRFDALNGQKVTLGRLKRLSDLPVLLGQARRPMSNVACHKKLKTERTKPNRPHNVTTQPPLAQYSQSFNIQSPFHVYTPV